jgi:MFS superfamily sulfate permease-like transporter
MHANVSPTLRQEGGMDIRREFLASIVVFLVALPLCMGIAIASGMPPAAGLITGIVGGIIVGGLSGAPLQVSGPAAGLSVMVLEIVQRQGFVVLAMAVLIAGAVQLAAGLLKFGQWFRAVSPAVIRGMLTGIGILIFAGQFHVMVDDVPRQSGLKNILSIPESMVKGLTPNDDSNHHWAAIVGLATILAIVSWKAFSKTRLKLVPGPLVAVVLGTLMTAAFGLNINKVAIPSTFLSDIKPVFSNLALLLDGQVIMAGLAIAFVASAETLLCATAVDKLHNGPRTKYDKELAAQGIGNMICGVFGALPMTGVIVRSAANVNAGAKTRASAILHGVWLLLFVAALPFLLNKIPTACLAAILVYTGYKLIDFKALKDLSKFGRGEVAIFVITVVMIVVADLLTGVLIGVGISAAKLLYTFSHLEIKLEDNPDQNRSLLRLRGAATFIRLPQLAAALDQVAPSRELHVRFEGLDYVDHACFDLLMNWEKQHESTGGRLVVDWDDLTAKFNRAENAGPTGNGESYAMRSLDREVVEAKPANGMTTHS